ncbi:MAG: DUF4105 domain-containing protein [Elusimicrobia bacterium]|nr:DUF4105 domain-containing protein [Elusimicrobiota bacterium]
MPIGKERAGRIIHALFLASLLLPAQVLALTPENNLRRLAIRQASAKAQAWKAPYWLKLLYYEKTLFGRLRSVSQNPEFFLAKWGNISPRLELEAAIDGLFFEGAPDNSPECRFPERYNWLRQKFGLAPDSFPPPRCGSFEDWKAGLDPESASLVFAAGSLHPSALYGNILLRLHKRGAAGGEKDQAAACSVSDDQERGFFFALKTLFGAYPVTLSAGPWSEKLEEYSGTANRDLWEFPLDLAPEELDRLLRHTWELGKASFPYRLFTANCSQRLIKFLDIVRPELGLSGRFSSWVIPSDALKAVVPSAPAVVPAWRPAVWETVAWKRGRLSESERRAALNLSRGGQAAELDRLAAADPVRRMAVFETAADYINWRFQNRLMGSAERENRAAPLLAALAPLEGRSFFPGGPPRPVPLSEAHESLRLGAGLVSLKNGPAYEIQGRAALQDLLDAPEGYLRDAALETGSFRLRYEKRYNRFYIKEARLAHILSLTPWDDWTRRRSWELSAGLEQAGETGRQSGRSAVWAMNAAGGFAAEWQGPVRQLWYAMLQADSGFGPALASSWRAGAGLKAGLLAEKGPVRASFEARYTGYAFGDTRPLWAGSAAASLKLGVNRSARFEYSWRGDVTEAGLYFHQFIFAP